jgi:hypothetical protein
MSQINDSIFTSMQGDGYTDSNVESSSGSKFDIVSGVLYSPAASDRELR